MPNMIDAAMPNPKNSWKELMKFKGANAVIIKVYIKNHNKVNGIIRYTKISPLFTSCSNRQKIPGIKKPVDQIRRLITKRIIAASSEVMNSLKAILIPIDIIVKKMKATIPAIPFPLPILYQLQYLIKYNILKMFRRIKIEGNGSNHEKKKSMFLSRDFICFLLLIILFYTPKINIKAQIRAKLMIIDRFTIIVTNF